MLLLYLDTMVFICALEGHLEDPGVRHARGILKVVEAGAVEAVTSELTLAEVLINESHGGEIREDLKKWYLDLIVSRGLVRLEPLTLRDMQETARIAAIQPPEVSLPERLHLATAIRAGATYFVTHDPLISVPPPLKKMNLSDHLAGRFLEELKVGSAP